MQHIVPQRNTFLSCGPDKYANTCRSLTIPELEFEHGCIEVITQQPRETVMAAPDWFTDCSNLVVRHICRIASVLVPVLFGVVLWYCNRIETKTADMQESLGQIELKVGILIDRQPTRGIPGPEGIAQK